MIFLRCTTPDHVGERIKYALMDMTGEAERPVAENRCPMCPESELEGPPDRLPMCPCCGSTWIVGGEEANCLPGKTTQLVQ